MNPKEQMYSLALSIQKHFSMVSGPIQALYVTTIFRSVQNEVDRVIWETPFRCLGKGQEFNFS